MEKAVFPQPARGESDPICAASRIYTSGQIYSALIDERLASIAFYLRIEDTDRNARSKVARAIIDMLAKYGIHFDEGATKEATKAIMAPTGSRSYEIYQTYAKQLVREGISVLCHEELDHTRGATAQKLTLATTAMGKNGDATSADKSGAGAHAAVPPRSEARAKALNSPTSSGT